MSETVRTEWGIQYGDGDIEGGLYSRTHAREVRRHWRTRIASGAVDAAGYEPMRIIRRRIVASDWEGA